jgi:hypothetical protein
MSELSHSCDPIKAATDRRRFLCYGALTVALAVGFGYSMASMKYQSVFGEVAETAKKERDSMHNRYMRQLGKKDKEIAALISACRPGVEAK